MTEEWSKLHWITLIPLVLRVTKTMLPVFLVSVFSAASSPNPSDYRTEVILTGLSALWVAALFMTTRFRSDGETISLRSGVIKKSTLTVKTSNVDTISVSQTPWSRLFGAAVVSVSDFVFLQDVIVKIETVRIANIIFEIFIIGVLVIVLEAIVIPFPFEAFYLKHFCKTEALRNNP